MSTVIRRAIALLLLWCLSAAHAQDTSSNDETLNAFIAGLKLQSGEITIPEANATLRLTPEFRYLGASDAQKVLENLWGNPPDDSVLGMLLPKGAASLTDDNSWAVVVTWSSDGFVSDADAAKIDYTSLLKDMQKDTLDDSEERKKAGYEAIQLVGWAAQPHYDQASNKLYWAKELAFGDNTEHTLNYDIRSLGRYGYLSLNAIGSMKQLPNVQTGMQDVLAMTTFDAGHRYADFDEKTDKVAAYGIGALVAGTLAAKAGLFAKIGIVLLKFWKLIAIGIFAFGGAITKLFKRKA